VEEILQNIIDCSVDTMYTSSFEFFSNHEFVLVIYLACLKVIIVLWSKHKYQNKYVEIWIALLERSFSFDIKRIFICHSITVLCSKT
jgi:hypothetical protein